MKSIPAILAALVLGACATGLNSVQEAELLDYEHRGLKVEEKSETAAAWLGLLPGGGSFYTGHVGFGIGNLLLWPLSIFWDPVSGHDAAEAINYAATRAHLRRLRNEAIDELNRKIERGEIPSEEAWRLREEIEREYDV